MRERFKALTEDTKISLGLAIIALGGAAFLTTMYVKGETTAEAVTKVEEKQDKVFQMLQSIDRRTARIEGLLDRRVK